MSVVQTESAAWRFLARRLIKRGRLLNTKDGYYDVAGLCREVDAITPFVSWTAIWEMRRRIQEQCALLPNVPGEDYSTGYLFEPGHFTLRADLANLFALVAADEERAAERERAAQDLLNQDLLKAFEL